MPNKKNKPIHWWNLKLEKKDFLNLKSAFDQKKISYNSVGLSLEKEICSLFKSRFALVTTSGSVSLLIALKALGLKAGDEVIVPNRTFQATANAVHFLGASVKLVDVRASDGLIDPEEVKKNITVKTKAIIAVHLNGRAAPVEQIKRIIGKKNISIIEDTAQAFASKHDGKFLGTSGDIGCFSFGVTKFLTSGQGGALITNSETIYIEANKFIFHSNV